MSEETDALIDAAEAYAEVYDGDDRQDIKTDVLNAFFAGSKYEATNKVDIATIAYMNGVAEGRKHKDALVAAAYRAAANVASGLGYGGEIADKILSLTPADAEKALRDFGMEVSSGVNEMLKERLRLAFDKSSLEQIVDEVMKK
jgi:hypothetical protein